MSESDRTIECAEYVLGTLSAEERAGFEEALVGEQSLRDEVARWEEWLAGLNDVIPAIEPSAEVWPAIERRLRAMATDRQAARTPAPTAGLAGLRRSRARWRAATVVFGALAAGLALFVVRDRLQPPASSYLAVVDRGGELPALIVHVDTARNAVFVRSVAAEAPPDRVLELWYIGGGLPPRSVGLLDRPETRAALPPGLHGADVAGATLAVSVEPKGGSPTGAPTGQVVYSGKLIRD